MKTRSNETKKLNFSKILIDLHKTSNYFWKHIENKGNVILDTILNFAYSAVIFKQRLLHEKNIAQYLKTKNFMTLIKAVLESPYKVLQRHEKQLS